MYFNKTSQFNNVKVTYYLLIRKMSKLLWSYNFLTLSHDTEHQKAGEKHSFIKTLFI